MVDVLSLSKARKTRARAEKEASAEANRLKHGRTEAEKAKDAAQKSLASRQIDAHRREPK